MNKILSNSVRILLLFMAIVLLLTHTGLVIEGAHTGLELWYHSVLPSVFPFMILTSLLRNNLQSDNICYLGLLCGLPVGAGLIDQQLSAGSMSAKKANILLGICNITSPMFICGYILNQTLQHKVSSCYFMLILYLPMLLYACIHFRTLTENHTHSTSTKRSLTSDIIRQTSNSSEINHSLEDILLHCIRIILMTGIYIMLFCIFIQILSHYVSGIISEPGNLYSDSHDSIRHILHTVSHILLSELEITNGIRILDTLPLSLHLKTALIAGLTSFGGICSIFQTQSAITHSELSFYHYILLKVIFSISTILLGLLIPVF